MRYRLKQRKTIQTGYKTRLANKKIINIKFFVGICIPKARSNLGATGKVVVM